MAALFYDNFNSAIARFDYIVPRRNKRITLPVIAKFHLTGMNAVRDKDVSDSYSTS
jgi:hypothetical protein